MKYLMAFLPFQPSWQSHGAQEAQSGRPKCRRSDTCAGLGVVDASAAALAETGAERPMARAFGVRLRLSAPALAGGSGLRRRRGEDPHDAEDLDEDLLHDEVRGGRRSDATPRGRAAEAGR